MHLKIDASKLIQIYMIQIHNLISDNKCEERILSEKKKK